jgi:VanZ family protein
LPSPEQRHDGVGTLLNLRSLPLLATLAVVLLLTLTPASASPDAASAMFDFEIRGLRGLADSIANVLLFLPIGVAAAVRFPGWRRPVLGALLLSVTIEVVQLAIPGRYTSPADVAFNTLGATIGVALAHTAGWWLRPPGPWRLLFGVAALAAGLLVLAGGVALLLPASTSRPAEVRWTPSIRGAPAYGGLVGDARLGSITLEPGYRRRGVDVRTALRAGDTLHVRFTAGPPPARAQAIVLVTDANERRTLGVHVRGDDVVVSWMTRGGTLRLDEPDIRVRGVLHDVAAGDEVELAAWRDGREHCVRVGARQECGLGHTIGDTWALLYYPVPGALAALLPVAWIMALLLPAGYWLNRPAEAAAAAMLAVGVLAAATPFVGVLATPLLQLAAAAAAIGLGAAAAHRLAGRT